ncbi:MAG: phytanoyl-CoA dioxygenase family protein [Chitinophagaceae bacterium]|nr:phytanoyl-CoA dioxygenase family protein [Chitinophagaceae bacterium]
MSFIPVSILSFLNEHYKLSEKEISFYTQNKFIKLKQVLNEETISFFSNHIKKRVEELSAGKKSLEERDTYGMAFLQVFNLWREDDVIKELVFSKRLAAIATDLMQTKGARLYHDQALYKEPGGGYTPWHADQYYWPLASDKTVTAWIPLQETPIEMGPLEFSAGSHVIVEGRELAISDASETILSKKLKVTDFQHVVEKFDLGEVSFHSGWIFHRAGANTTETMRQVMTIIYMDRDMQLAEPKNENQVNDWNTWCPGASVGEIIDTHLNPILYTK